MQIVSQIAGHIHAANSDDGTVSVTSTPSTRLYGDFGLVDTLSGLRMWRGEYLDAATGTANGTRVPAALWTTAVALMREISDLNGAAEDRAAQAAVDSYCAKAASQSESIARDMDRANSDN